MPAPATVMLTGRWPVRRGKVPPPPAGEPSGSREGTPDQWHHACAWCQQGPACGCVGLLPPKHWPSSSGQGWFQERKARHCQVFKGAASAPAASRRSLVSERDAEPPTVCGALYLQSPWLPVRPPHPQWRASHFPPVRELTASDAEITARPVGDAYGFIMTP